MELEERIKNLEEEVSTLRTIVDNLRNAFNRNLANIFVGPQRVDPPGFPTAQNFRNTLKGE